MSGRTSGSKPYSVTESNAVERRVAGWPSESRWKRRLVRKASPSPANMRAGPLAVALEREDPGGEREAAGQVLEHEEPQQLAVVVVAGEGDPTDREARQRFLGERRAQLAVSRGHHLLVARVGLHRGRPVLEQCPRLGVEAPVGGLGQLGQLRRVCIAAALGHELAAVASCWSSRAATILAGHLVVVGRTAAAMSAR
jgi:hypothetical protein